MQKKFLIAPGPTPVPEEARLAMARELMHHRGPEFKQLFNKVRAQLQWLFETKNEVLTLTCSGTGAFEAVIINYTRREDTLISIGGGKFGERWGKVAKAYGMNVVELEIPWGQAADPDALAELLARYPDCAMVTLSASETSTGVYHPVKELAAVIQKHSQALFAVDGITAVGVHRLPMDEWGIDILVSGSQKAFGIPPGLGFVAANERAWERYEHSNHPKFYFDLGRERTNQLKDQTAFTPAISLVVALHEVLKLMQAEGLEELIARHTLNASAARAGVLALGCELYAETPANSATAAVVPEGIDAQKIVRAMRDQYGVTIAGGQDHLVSTVFRIGHIGFFDRSDMILAMSALESALFDAGADIELGSGLRAVQEVYAHHTS